MKRKNKMNLIFNIYIYYFALLININFVYSVTIYGSNFTNGNLIPSNGDILSGIFINVNSFIINELDTIYIDDEIKLEIHCLYCEINGTLNGNGKGGKGGNVNINLGEGGLRGENIGGGEGGVYGEFIHGSGGGGGGFGNIGGNASSIEEDVLFPASGGTLYGNSSAFDNSNIFMGSGGGSGSNTGSAYDSFGGSGGNGGASISIIAEYNITINDNGQVLCDGNNGNLGVYNAYQNDWGSPGGGGGSGGSIYLQSEIYISASSLLSCKGGKGGDANTQLNETIQAGGGGSGGRIKLLGVVHNENSINYDISGGIGGIGYPELGFGPFVPTTSGGDGTKDFQNISLTTNNDTITDPYSAGDIINVNILLNDNIYPNDESYYGIITVPYTIPSLQVIVIINSHIMEIYIGNYFIENEIYIEYHVCHQISPPNICSSSFVNILNIINLNPEFTSIPITNSIQGQEYLYNITYNDPENQGNISCVIIEGPIWMSILQQSDFNSILYGIPPIIYDNDNEYSDFVSIKITDLASNTQFQNYTIISTNNSGNISISLTLSKSTTKTVSLSISQSNSKSLSKSPSTSISISLSNSETLSKSLSLTASSSISKIIPSIILQNTISSFINTNTISISPTQSISNSKSIFQQQTESIISIPSSYDPYFLLSKAPSISPSITAFQHHTIFLISQTPITNGNNAMYIHNNIQYIYWNDYEYNILEDNGNIIITNYLSENVIDTVVEISVPSNIFINNDNTNNNVLIYSNIADISTINYYDQYTYLSDAIEIILIDQNTGDEIRDFGLNNANLCFNYIDPTYGSENLCLAFYNDYLNEWECLECFYYQDYDYNTVICGQTHHFTTFAVILSGNNQNNNDNSSSDGDYIISFKADIILICICISFCIIIIIIVIFIGTFVNPIKKRIMGKEGYRISTLRSTTVTNDSSYNYNR